MCQGHKMDIISLWVWFWDQTYKRKKKKVVDTLNRTMHLVDIRIFKSDLKKRVIASLVEDEHYIQVNDGLQ